MEKRDVVTAEELAVTNMIELDALVQLLVRKGLVTESELLDEIRLMKARIGKGRPQGSV